MSGIAGQGEFHQSISVNAAPATPINAGLRYLWARHRIAELSDRIALSGPKAPELESEVTSLGISYNLLTKFTSFIAIDKTARRLAGQALLVKQPLPSVDPGGVRVRPDRVRPEGGIDRRMAFDTLESYDDDDDSDYPESVVRGVYGASYANTPKVIRKWRSAMFERSGTLSASATDSLVVNQGFRYGAMDGPGSRLSLPFLLRAGLGKSMELRLGSTLIDRTDSATRSPDIRVGVKAELPMLSRYQFALLAEYGTAFDTDDPRQYSGQGSLLIETSVLELGVRANFGIGHLRLRDSLKNLFGFAYGAELSWYSRLSRLLSIRPYLGVSGLSGNADQSFAEFGVLFQAGTRLGVGIEGQAGLSDESDTVTSGLFLRYRL